MRRYKFVKRKALVKIYHKERDSKFYWLRIKMTSRVKNKVTVLCAIMISDKFQKFYRRGFSFQKHYLIMTCNYISQ